MPGILDKIRALAIPNYTGPAGAVTLSRDQEHIATPNLQVKQVRSLKDKLKRGEVGHSPDLSRIMALPRRVKPDLGDIARELTQRLRKPGGTMDLWDIQAWALWEGPWAGGLVGSIAVGGGKTAVGLLMPMVMPGCRRAVLLVPAGLKGQLLERDWERYSKHWHLPNLAGWKGPWQTGLPVLHVVTYNELSNPKATTMLKGLAPDLVCADECQHLKGRVGSHPTRVKRLLHYFAEAPETRFCGWSGTITSSSVRDYTHLAALALGTSSPVPVSPSTVEEWAAALDPNIVGYFDPGQLLKFCEKDEPVRSGYRRRLVDTLGFVATAESQLGVALNFYERSAPPMPEELKKAMGQVRKSKDAGGWIRPDGEELVDALSVDRCLRQLATGHYSRWRFPRGEPPELIDRWFNRRQDWNRELRQKLSHSRPHLDSPKLCTQAAIRWYKGGCKECERGIAEYHKRSCSLAEEHPVWASEAWPAWRDIAGQVYHESEAVWLSDFMVTSVAEWALAEPGIVWTEQVAFGEALAKRTRLPYYGEGQAASVNILKETGKRSIIASVKAHSEGKNLQEQFWRNLIVTVQPDAKGLEQLIGRTHRSGQPKDEVEVHLYRHTPELHDALEKAQERARYIQETTGSHQKLVYGSYSFK